MTIYESPPAQFLVRPDDAFPLVVGYHYLLKPIMAGQWVRIVSLDAKNVYVTGVNAHRFDPAPIPRWRFDDVVDQYLIP